MIRCLHCRIHDTAGEDGALPPAAMAMGWVLSSPQQYLARSDCPSPTLINFRYRFSSISSAA